MWKKIVMKNTGSYFACSLLNNKTYFRFIVMEVSVIYVGVKQEKGNKG
jgi:hypothetical protein